MGGSANSRDGSTLSLELDQQADADTADSYNLRARQLNTHDAGCRSSWCIILNQRIMRYTLRTPIVYNMRLQHCESDENGQRRYSLARYGYTKK